MRRWLGDRGTVFHLVLFASCLLGMYGGAYMLASTFADHYGMTVVRYLGVVLVAAGLVWEFVKKRRARGIAPE
jgi:hypothetical protein